MRVTRGNGDEDDGRNKGNMYKGPMDKDNGVGIVFGSRGWMRQGRATVGKIGTTVNEQQ